MNKRLALVGGLLVLTAVVGVTALRLSKTVAPAAVARVPVKEDRIGVTNVARAAAGRTRAPTRLKTEPARDRAGVATEQAASGDAVDTTALSALAAETPTPRERALADWDQEIENVVARTDAPTGDDAVRMKAAFDRLDKADQMDAIRSSLNLLPDEQFAVLYGILYDKDEDPDVLDAIFSDALSRPEAIKNPLMKELRKDPTHPMFFESARILDVVGAEEEEADPQVAE